MKFKLNLTGCGTAKVRFVTDNVDTHLNVCVTDRFEDSASVSLEPSQARKLRDELNRVYPVLAPAPTPKARPRGAQVYKGNGKHEQEVVTHDDCTHVQRLRVPGGWIYQTTTIDPMDASIVGVTATFVPVPTAVGYAI